MTSIYNGIQFDTPLLARWAAFFDLASWEWSSNIAAVGSWKPDFRVTFGCTHSECAGSHTILVSVLPVSDLSQNSGHPALSYSFSVTDAQDRYLADAGALFGLNPNATVWVMSHGAGGGTESVPNWEDDAFALWRIASTKIAD